MKKTMTLFMAGIVSAAVLTGCAGEKTQDVSSVSETSSVSESADSSSTDISSASGYATIEYIDGDYSYEDCMELPEYKGMELKKNIKEIKDSDVREYYSNLIEAEAVSGDEAAKDGDIVVMDYETKFEGGDYGESGNPSGTDFSVMIGSKSTIDGFEAGLIGHKTGDEVYLDLQFPDDYFSADYAGRPVTFHITVKEIKRTPEPTDEWVSEYTAGEYSTVEEYDAYIKDMLERNAEDTATAQLREDAWNKLFDGIDFKKLPKTLVDEGTKSFDDRVESEMASYGVSDLDDYIESSGLTKDQYEELRTNWGEAYAKNILVVDYIWDTEKMTKENEFYKKALQQLADAASLSTEDLLEQHDEESIGEYCKSIAVNDVLVENAKVTVNKTED